MAAECILHGAIRDLWIKINNIHYKYLNEENLSTKLKYRTTLQKDIKEFLSIVPHSQKFNFQETAEALHRSIRKVKSCNILRIANAWQAVASYANNLYSQPWRTEFREIKLYCGYYKQQVESYLVGCECLLQMMGYVRHPDHKLVFDVRTDPDMICAISQDAIIAFTECHIIFSIYKDISKKVPTCTLAEVLEYREANACLISQAVEGIYYFYYRQSNSCCAECHHDCYSPPPAHCSSAPCIHYRVPCCAMYSSKYSCGPKNGYRDYSPKRGTTRDRSCHRCRDHVPTGELVDIDGLDLYPQNDFTPVDLKSSNSASDIYNSASLPNERESRERKWESWDYVYKGLEKSKEPKTDGISKYATAKPSKVTKALSNLKIDTSKKRYDTVDSPKKVNAMVNTPKSMFESKAKKGQSKSEFAKSSDKWECATCTYHNRSSKKVCEMCGKSKVVGNEVKPLMSGGRQCPQCTLVNDKDATLCAACECSLKNSPTYI